MPACRTWATNQALDAFVNGVYALEVKLAAASLSSSLAFFLAGV